MNKKLIGLASVFCVTVSVFAQVEINAQKEVLYEIDLDSCDIHYSNTDEGLCGLEAPLVMDNGDLFFYETYNQENTYTYKKTQLNKSEIISGIIYYDADSAVSQNGIIKMDDGFYILSQKKKYNYKDLIKNYIKNSITPDYAVEVPKGIVCYWGGSENKALGFEFTKDNLKLIDSASLDQWLKLQGYSFDIQKNQILKGTVIVSPSKPKGQGGSYIGKLKNGFNIYSFGDSCIFITDSTGNIVLKSFIPWDNDNKNDEEKRYFYFGVGPYGELYYSLAPAYDEIPRGDYYKYVRREGSNPQIAVVRNHLKYFGVLTDNNIRLRSGPTTSSKNLGTYPIDTGFMILEKGTKQETIGGDTGVWYKVRLLDGKEGWFFGAYVRDLYDGPGTPLPWPNVADWK